MSYSLSFRKKVMDIKEKEELSFVETGKRFHIGRATLHRWQKRIEPCIKRNKPATKINMKALKKDVEENPDSYQWERANTLGVSQSAIFYALKRLGKSYKKNSISSKSKRSTQKRV